MTTSPPGQREHRMAKRPPSQSQRGIEIARRHCHDRRQAARDERIADRAEQQHLGDRLEKLDYALHAEDALNPVQRVDAIALELHRLAAPAERDRKSTSLNSSH